jgi:hypothetical protein
MDDFTLASVVPEPGNALMLLAGLTVLAAIARAAGAAGSTVRRRRTVGSRWRHCASPKLRHRRRRHRVPERCRFVR